MARRRRRGGASRNRGATSATRPCGWARRRSCRRRVRGRRGHDLRGRALYLRCVLCGCVRVGGAPDPHETSSSPRTVCIERYWRFDAYGGLMCAVVSCIGGVESPISGAISRFCRLCVRLVVHLAGYHRNAVAMCSPLAHIERLVAHLRSFRRRKCRSLSCHAEGHARAVVLSLAALAAATFPLAPVR